jgi:hypothetical protein
MFLFDSYIISTNTHKVYVYYLTVREKTRGMVYRKMVILVTFYPFWSLNGKPLAIRSSKSHKEDEV